MAQAFGVCRAVQKDVMDGSLQAKSAMRATEPLRRKSPFDDRFARASAAAHWLDKRPGSFSSAWVLCTTVLAIAETAVFRRPPLEPLFPGHFPAFSQFFLIRLPAGTPLCMPPPELADQ